MVPTPLPIQSPRVLSGPASGGGLRMATTLPLLRISITVSPATVAWISPRQCAAKSTRLSCRVLVMTQIKFSRKDRQEAAKDSERMIAGERSALEVGKGVAACKVG